MATSMERSSGVSRVEEGVSEGPRISTPSPIFRYSDYQMRSQFFLVFFDIPDPNLRYGIVAKNSIYSNRPFFEEGDTVIVKFGPTSFPGKILKMSEDAEYLYRKYAKFVRRHETFLVHKELRMQYRQSGYPTQCLMELLHTRGVHVAPPTRKLMTRMTFDDVEDGDAFEENV